MGSHGSRHKARISRDDTDNASFSRDVTEGMSDFSPKLERLKNMEVFILDNTMRETTVAALKAHTVENKRAIYEEIKKCGFKYFIVESFNSQTRIGDLFLEELINHGEDLTNAFAFSELWENLEEEIPQPDIPIGLTKCKQFGINNVVLEFDLMYYKIDYDEFDMEEICWYFKDKVDWIRANLSPRSLILINIRDFSQTMEFEPHRVGYFVNFVSSLPPEERILGLIFEDLGKVLPAQLGAWTRAVRNEMDRCGWTDGQLLFHQHEQWGMMHSANLEVLANGATGMWAAVCMEGAGMGHADTCTALLNLIRLGNTAVQKQYNCKYLRKAAIEVTKLVTGKKPAPKQPIYGPRALDLVFGFLFSDPTAQGGFNMAEFLGVKKEVRISNMANAEMIKMKLVHVFGRKPQFTLEMAGKMKEQMLKNAADNRKEEYNSAVGLAMLYDQSGGHLTADMAQKIQQGIRKSKWIESLIEEIKKEWDQWDNSDGLRDNKLSFQDFYNGFMAPYFGCYRCEDSQRGLQALDMDEDGGIDWFEFKHFLVWAGREHPEVEDAQELLDIAFRDGLIPAMKDETDILKQDKKDCGEKAGKGKGKRKKDRGKKRSKGKGKRKKDCGKKASKGKGKREKDCGKKTSKGKGERKKPVRERSDERKCN